jgi:DNA (cytosine-5)-methyltransferase 1
MKCIDLFSGCGGFSLGMELAGFEVILALDNWDFAIENYRLNFKHPIIKQDLSNTKEVLSLLLNYDPDIIIGGPPCQDFSSAGMRDIGRGRADLTISFSEIVCSIQPAWFVMENVEQIKHSSILKNVIAKFTESGYGLSSVILKASYCNVPQNRTRFFLIGKLGSKHNQLLPTLKSRLSIDPLTIKDYLGDSLGIDYYYRHPRNYNRRAIFSIDEPSPTIRGVNRPIPKGYKLNTCDPQGIDLSEIRPLTTLERSYIQTFPRSFIFSGAKTNLEQMIGNAVPVNLGKFIGESILNFKQETSGQLLLPDYDPPFLLAETSLKP